MARLNASRGGSPAILRTAPPLIETDRQAQHQRETVVQLRVPIRHGRLFCRRPRKNLVGEIVARILFIPPEAAGIETDTVSSWRAVADVNAE
jgi:hypothetical protein